MSDNQHSSHEPGSNARRQTMVAKGLAAVAASIALSAMTVSADDQVRAGQTLYAEHCATCHSLNLRGSAHGSTLSGDAFLSKWGDQDAMALLAYTRANMPPGNSAALSDTQQAAIARYLIDSNQTSPAGEKLLFTSAPGLAELGEDIDEDGSNQTTPLVHRGVMYLAHPGNVIQALDAASGELIWEYRYQFPATSRTLGGPTRNIAIYGDKLYMATYDAAIVAIDARSGKEVWRTEKADFERGYTHTAGPIIGDGVVLSGINGCEWYKEEGCFITGHDAETGKELWRTSTIALPGTPGGDTWAGLPAEMRAGGDNWIAGSYDPQLKLFFVGTSQAKPWVAVSRGMSPVDAALYTNSTLALRPDTGELVWYFQHIAGETIDMEVGFERVLIDIDGTPLLVTIGKDGLLWKLNRATGEYLDVAETLPQNIYAEVDKVRGKVTYRDDILNAQVGDTMQACPGIYGGHNWQASAYSPEAEALIIPLHQLCSDMVGREVEQKSGSGGYGADSRTYEMPGVDGMLGRLAAWDINTLTERWAHEQRAMFMTGALTTAGGLVFIGDLDRYFKAFDVATGKLLWQSRLGAPTHGYPISFGVKGKQYVAVPTGIGVFRAMTAVVSPEIYQPTGGEALYVFELP